MCTTTWGKPRQAGRGKSMCSKNLDRPYEHILNLSKSSTRYCRVADTSQSSLPGNPVSIDPGRSRIKLGDGDDNRMIGKLLSAVDLRRRFDCLLNTRVSRSVTFYVRYQ